MRISDYTLRNLRTFCAVVEHGGFGGAQEIIGAGQSVISTHLRDLEATLGFSLCQRGRAGFALTEKGEAVYQHAKHVLGSVDDCEANLGALRRILTGHLRVGIVDSEADNPDLPVHEAIFRFFSREHQVRLTLDVGTPELLSKSLQTGDTHVAIGPFPNRQANISYTPIYAEEHVLYCGVRHPLFQVPLDEISLQTIAAHPMTLRPYLQRSELAALPNPSATAMVSNMEAQAMLIRSGSFLGFLPSHFARKWVERGEMRSIALPGIGWRSQFYIAHRTQPDLPQVAQKFIDDLTYCLSRLGQLPPKPGGSAFRQVDSQPAG